ncbi:HAMP domain-containing histidine kinase [Clostridium sp. 19966]|uniref:sensor histidine kinase n=1 Tax=Clostridium sp. 19966 TaxID=2768166 RepID=UPI0028DD44EF|nr:HAMP domain-containing sensor histidine kinase [Clostridium sp. 19966]MDT8717790.1 HAMP domain-containing histidine kinase [Clostridium sp. 19966]
MKSNSIKWRIFKYNIIAIITLITLTTIIFNFAAHMYMKKDTLTQLNKIASNAEFTALEHGPDFFPTPQTPPSDKKNKFISNPIEPSSDPFRYYYMLEHSLKEPLTLLNADFILLDNNKNRVVPYSEKSASIPENVMEQLKDEIDKSMASNKDRYLTFKLSNIKYIAVVKPVSDKNSFGLGWIIIYSSLEKINQLQLDVNIILLSILIFSAIITTFITLRISEKITEPFAYLNKYIRAIAERNFGNKIETPVYEELNELVENINIMSEKLENYDKAQKTFLENVSHEFRTPLMSIQSYAEGIKYDVVESQSAAEIIMDETSRMTKLVEDLLYLSRLEAIEENYNISSVNFNELIHDCVSRMNLIAAKKNIQILSSFPYNAINIVGDKERLSRAIINIISNCIQYANSYVKVDLNLENENLAILKISDDGPGFNANELLNIFERFYKGKKGNFGLGLSISKNIIEKSKGKIMAENSEDGALFIIELPFYF